MTPSQRRSALEQALGAKDWRQFLTRYVDGAQKAGASLNWSRLGRAAGFTSRSYLSEMISGKKRMNPISLRKISGALRLTGPSRLFFEIIASADEASNDTPLPLKAESLRKKALARLALNGGTAERRRDSLFHSRDAMLVLASLGSTESGATIQEIISRSKLSSNACTRALERATAAGLARKSGERYYVNFHDLVVHDQGRRPDFKSVYMESLRDAQTQASEQFERQDALFYQMMMPVRAADMPRLRQRLREALDEFTEAAGNEQGDSVSRLTLAFYL